jgi:membrane protease YdiL (CAAX protease family)
VPHQEKSGQIGFSAALGMWLALALAGTLYAGWHGYGGRALAACVIAFAVLFAGELLPAARGVAETVRRALPPPIGWLLAAPILLAWFVYAFNTGSLTIWSVAIACAYVLAPLALLSLAMGAASGPWDYAAILALALPVKLLLLRPLWPYPDGRLAYTFTMLLAMNVGVAGFLIVRRLEGVGYSIGWGKDWAFFIGLGFLAVAAVDIPAGRALDFLYWAPGHAGWASLPLSALAIFFFTAWPEEFLFRGLLQNLLSRSMKSEGAGWACASVIFGLSHIRNGGFWNWKYALLATFAGFCYGWTWRKTGSIFGSAIVHCAVDTAWHALFR